MADKILITGGAGFIGSFLADELIKYGYHVRALDNLSEQVHGSEKVRPEYLHPDVELVIGDVRDSLAVKKALNGIDAVFHFAVMVGVGQSMYKIKQYTDINNMGTAVLLEALSCKPVKKLIVGSSMSVYGEGLYHNIKEKNRHGKERNLQQLKASKWELYDRNGMELIPVPTPESKVPFLTSVYALSKYQQEQLCFMIGRAYNISTTALRFFNVYGPRQALSNPYTGVLPIFASRFLNNNPPLVFEDGFQLRDFVNVRDVAAACRLALEKDGLDGEVFNIGSGKRYTIRQIVTQLATVLNKNDIHPEITGKYRLGDIRHCFADINKAKNTIGYQPRIFLEEGLIELAGWLKGQVAHDHVHQAKKELLSRGLAI